MSSNLQTLAQAGLPTEKLSSAEAEIFASLDAGDLAVVKSIQERLTEASGVEGMEEKTTNNNVIC